MICSGSIFWHLISLSLAPAKCGGRYAYSAFAEPPNSAGTSSGIPQSSIRTSATCFFSLGGTCSKVVLPRIILEAKSIAIIFSLLSAFSRILNAKLASSLRINDVSHFHDALFVEVSLCGKSGYLLFQQLVFRPKRRRFILFLHKKLSDGVGFVRGRGIHGVVTLLCGDHGDAVVLLQDVAQSFCAFDDLTIFVDQKHIIPPVKPASFAG
uniref:Uncharacterized protein n=1 Tax=Siphoviridae sp. ct8Cp41 TaxID=2825358 RepID=A0A8S5UB47_9CAUD|nr:MAG TPA: hypothetical protein [Siphoviridae sp. ct8Cp41]